MERYGYRTALTPLFSLAVLLLFLLQGCAEHPRVFNVDPNPQSSADRPVWPTPPQTPRYKFFGELVGEQNLVLEEESNKEGFASALRWMAGVNRESAKLLELRRPQGGITDRAGHILVADVGLAGIFYFDPGQATVALWRRATDRAEFVAPIDLEINNDDELMISDAELGLVVVLDSRGNPLRTIGDGVLKRPTGLAYDAEHGVLYVADTVDDDIKVFSDRGEMIRRIGGATATQTGLNSPTFLAFADERLYVTDTLNARVQVFDPSGHWLQTIGSRGLAIGNLVRPKGIAVDSDGNIYVVESYYDHLLVFNREGEFLMAVGGTGDEVGHFNLPTSVWIDERDAIYVGDMMNARIQIFQYLGGNQ